MRGGVGVKFYLHYMEISGKIQAPAAFPRSKQPSKAFLGIKAGMDMVANSIT
jgi:hypothetical protein